MKAVEFGVQNPEVILLLHGGGLSWWNFRQEAQVLGQRFHVILPILDGHAGSDAPFTSIENNAAEIISWTEESLSKPVILIGGLSLGAQIALEILCQRPDFCPYAVIESALVIPSPLTCSLIAPSIASSYWLISKRWFARLQFRYLRMPKELFEEYYRDSMAISKANMISFLQANEAYPAKDELKNIKARVRIVAGEKEPRPILHSAKLLAQRIPDTHLEIRKGLTHGGYSLSQPDAYAKDLVRLIRG